eukprot:3136175-Rhodomonas_salina.3
MGAQDGMLWTKGPWQSPFSKASKSTKTIALMEDNSPELRPVKLRSVSSSLMNLVCLVLAIADEKMSDNCR